LFQKLTEEVWYGNADAPFETIGQVGCIINVAHNVPRNYCRRLTHIPYDTMYLRLAKKDADYVDSVYLMTLAQLAESARWMKRMPILTHCRMGKHRGPTSALAVAFFLSDKKRATFEALHAKLLTQRPGLRNAKAPGAMYYVTTVELLRSLCLCEP